MSIGQTPKRLLRLVYILPGNLAAACWAKAMPYAEDLSTKGNISMQNAEKCSGMDLCGEILSKYLDKTDGDVYNIHRWLSSYSNKANARSVRFLDAKAYFDW